MRLIELFRSIKGYIIFTAYGGFSERFINLCMRSRVPVFDTLCHEKEISAKIFPEDFRKLRKIARKTGVRIKVKDRKGLPFFIKRHNHRCGLIFSLVFFILFSVIMNRFLWCIDASGSVRYSSEQIKEAARSVGIKEGIFIPSFDEGAAARGIYRCFDNNLSWVTVNFKGSKCFIEVRDSDSSLRENTESKQPCNIIADFDGVILSDETYSGIKITNKGSAVKKGDLLISGVMENPDFSATYYPAKGNFTAMRENKDAVSFSLKEKLKSYSSYKNKYILHILGLNIPFGSVKGENFAVRKNVQFASQGLPFGLSIITVPEENTVSTDEKTAFILACDNYTDKTYDKYKNTKIINSHIKINKSASEIKLTGEYSCIDFIGISQPILTENIESK